jgi:hypothetical protein
LDSYSALVYTYPWSLVIAKDLFSQFDRTKLLDLDKAKRYRDTSPLPRMAVRGGHSSIFADPDETLQPFGSTELNPLRTLRILPL